MAAPVSTRDLADALADMIDLADAWAACGPETYTAEERERRDAAYIILCQFDRQQEREG